MTGPIAFKVQANLQWQVRQTKTGAFVGTCEPLGLATEGVDPLELYLNANESVQLVMNDLLKTGQLDSFLRERGWRVISRPQGTVTGPVPFEVPMELVAQQAQRDPSRSAY